MMEGQASGQQLGKCVHLLEATVLLRQLFKPDANFFFDEGLFFRRGKEMERGTYGGLFDDAASWQEKETRQQVGCTQGRQYLSWLRRSLFRRAPGFLFFLDGGFC